MLLSLFLVFPLLLFVLLVENLKEQATSDWLWLLASSSAAALLRHLPQQQRRS